MNATYYAGRACYWSLFAALVMLFLSTAFVSALAAFVYFDIGGLGRIVGGVMLVGNSALCTWMPFRMFRQHRITAHLGAEQ